MSCLGRRQLSVGWDAQSSLTNAYGEVITEGEGSHCQGCAELRTGSAAKRQSDKFSVGIGWDAEKD